MIDKQRKNINVVAAIIRKGDKIFATQRGYGEWKDWWEFPGGSSARAEEARRKEEEGRGRGCRKEARSEEARQEGSRKEGRSQEACRQESEKG